MADNLIISDAFPPWLARTKILPIQQHVALIDRPELWRRLDEGLDRKLSLVIAPAGFGKSILLDGWRKKLLGRDYIVPWVNIDKDDDDPPVFATCLAYSLACAGLAQDITGLHPRGFNLEISPKTVLGILVTAISRQNRKIILILDEVEKLGRGVVTEIIDPLLLYAPDNLHIAIAGRTTGEIQLSSLKSKGQVSQITTTDLKFTPFEIEETLGDILDRKNLSNASKKIEGWPVVVQLIKNALSGHSDYNTIVDKFNGTLPDPRDYIYEQILDHLPPDQKNLLLDISIFEQFNPEVADIVRERDNSQTILRELEKLYSLISAEEGRYRLHPLLRQSLIYYLEERHPQRLKKLHLKAVDMFFEQGHIIQSINHALQAGEPEVAADILEKAGGILLWNREGMTRIRKAHALLPEHVINSRPRLSLLRALILLKDGHLNDARLIYNRISEELENNDQPHSAELDYDLAVITATLAVYEGTPLKEKMSDRLIASIESLKEIDRLQIGFVYTILCVFNLQKGDFPEARKVGHKAISFFRKHQSLFGETYIYVHLGVIATAEGRLDEAHENFRKVQDSQRRYFADDKDLRLIINILVAEWHYERNELGRAARLLKNVNQRLEAGEAWYEIYATGYSISTALAYLQKGLGACLNLSDEATSYIRREGLKRLNRLVIANEVGYLCRGGKIAEARNIVQENNLNFLDYKRSRGIYFSVRECYGVIQALGRLLIAEKRYDDAIRELQTQIKDHESSCETRAIQKYRLLLSIALFKKGETDKAFQGFEQVLIFVRTNGFLRFIMDEEPFVIPLLDAYVGDKSSSEKDHARYLLGQMNDINPPQNNVTLSRREKQVLDQLAEGYSDKLIARNLEISENTIRFHLNNLFGKLDVNSRLMAVSEARKHNLL